MSQQQLRKYRIEECNNRFIVIVSKGKDAFVGRWAFMNIEQVCSFLRDKTKSAPSAELDTGRGPDP